MAVVGVWGEFALRIYSREVNLALRIDGASLGRGGSQTCSVAVATAAVGTGAGAGAFVAAAAFFTTTFLTAAAFVTNVAKNSGRFVIGRDRPYLERLVKRARLDQGLWASRFIFDIAEIDVESCSTRDLDTREF